MAKADDLALLSVAEMARADAHAVAAGVPGERLMDNAGAAVARAVAARFQPRPTVVLCGPGDNGGDGYVAARRLAEAGWPVAVAALVPPAAMRGDAARHAALWRREVLALDPSVLSGRALAIDALFGAGLARPLDGAALAVVEAVGARGLDCAAVDVPSGVDGDSGAVRGAAPACRLTVTFFRKKPAHVLFPGRALAGEIVVADIGIPAKALDEIAPALHENGPALWRLVRPGPSDHKYARGHAVVQGGAEMTGAARLAARGALRAGAGLVTIAAPPEAFAVYAGDWASLLVAQVPDSVAFARLLDDARKNAVLIGPGAGVGGETRTRALAALERGKRVVLDADALTSFAGAGETLFRAIRSPCLLTPHEGEFRRLFGALDGSKVARARMAAKASGAAVLLKGADSVIASPDGRAVVNTNAPPDLATAGAGDVLAGLALGLIASGMEPFEAGAAASWLHGAAAAAVGPGLVAEDLPEAVAGVLKQLAARAAI